jgi:membrane protein
MAEPSNGSAKSEKSKAASTPRWAAMLAPVAAHAQRGYDTVMKVTASRLPQMAAALSYRTIFSLIPMIVVGLVTVAAFATREDIRKIVSSGLDYAGLTQIAVNPELTPEEEAVAVSLGSMGIKSSDIIQPDPLPQMSNALGTGSKRLDEWITELVDKVSSIPLGQITIIGILTLVYAAISMFIEVEHAFNQVFRVPDGRSFMRRVVIYWTMLTLGSLGLVATFYVGEKVKLTVGAFPGMDGTLAGYLVSIPITTSILLVAYTAIPNTRVRILPALAGAFIAAVMFEAGKLAFSEYIKYSAGYARLYGSLALIPLFLMWVYVTWLIVLAGLQLTYRLQHGTLVNTGTGPVAVGPVVVDPGSAAAILGAAAVSFRQGSGVTAVQLAKETGLSDLAATLLADKLTLRGFLHRVARTEAEASNGAPLVGGEEPSLYALARPPEGISLADVLRVGFDLADEANAHRAPNPVQRELRAVQLRAAGGATLASTLQAAEQSAQNPEPSGIEPRIATAS